MKFQPVKWGVVYAPSETSTVQNYGLGHFTKLMPASGLALDAQANQVTRFLTLGSQTKLAKIRGYEANWDGCESAKPLASAIANAEARLPELYRLSSANGVWREPHISANELGEISFEWWSGPRKVTMYFGENSLEALRVWGPNIETEMDLQEMPTLDAFPVIWAWLYGN